jgi:hypothetical protein
MTPFDYSTPPPQTALNLIPAKTIVLACMTINPGGAGEDGMLTHSKTGTCELLSYSLTVRAGEYAKRKILGQFIVGGPPDKYEDQTWRSRRTLKRILDASFNLDPSAMSPEAKAKRNVDFVAFDGLVFHARIAIEPGNGDWPAKNILAGTVTRNEGDWPGPIEQTPRPNGSEASSTPGRPSPPDSPVSPAPIARPSWAE